MIGEGDEAYQLPPMVAMDIEMYDTISWRKEEMLKRKWTVRATANQLKMRNLPSVVNSRSERLTAEYRRRNLLGVGAKLRVSAPGIEQLAVLVRQVLEAEEVAKTADAAATAAVAKTQTQERQRSRRSRRGRAARYQAQK